MHIQCNMLQLLVTICVIFPSAKSFNQEKYNQNKKIDHQTLRILNLEDNSNYKEN
ncbi:hypothetical protein CIPAW_01G203900 [Carya illinoinensis]|uniref:Uncharacterized protein n=1 Tax=Carya illinoinensis TaxID=32201 RepID=A0A8T1RS68_CARIL|nr:hypothetical protein CIPAW_01G203900 [Carya illinoinensis]